VCLPADGGTAAALLVQYVSFNAAPGGIGEPGPLQYVLSTNTLEHLHVAATPVCPYGSAEAVGDSRRVRTGSHTRAQTTRANRARTNISFATRIGRIIDDALWRGHQRLAAVAAQRLAPNRPCRAGLDGRGPAA
jgi:hypothetical protein